MRTVGILTLGCKVNTYESEYIIHLLKEAGYQIKDFDDACDVYIINTCTVTNTSDIKSRKMIRKAIRKNPDACVVAMGCFIEANKDFQLPGLDIILGNRDKSKIIELLDEWFLKQEEIRRLYSTLPREFEDMYINEFPGRTRAFVKIQDGCENFCSYCIIPFVRGKCRSKNPDEVIDEITDLVNHGYQEVVLTGIHTGNYGVDLDTNFASLLKRVVAIPGLLRLRISSIEITELTKDVLDVIRDSSIIVDHMHIPLQAGSDEILKRMNRKYTLEEFGAKLKQIREIRPDIAITTDIIVGFAGETDKDFEDTLDVVRKVNFEQVYMFIYSRRNGTPGDKMENQVPDKIKHERFDRLKALVEEQIEVKNKEYVGTIQKVLVEGTSKNNEKLYTGRTDSNKVVIFEGEQELINKIIDLKIVSEHMWYLKGEKVRE